MLIVANIAMLLGLFKINFGKNLPDSACATFWCKLDKADVNRIKGLALKNTACGEEIKRVKCIRILNELRLG